ncbi:MAG: RIP metalloprotease RseP [Candidatus Gracilibacteria bacterium]
MSIFVTVILFIIVFSILVLAHELGHFIAAKRSGIKVEEFGIGFPPRIWGRKKGETLYSINAIPFGGFVKLFGMEGEGPSLPGAAGTKRSLKNFSNRSMRTRAKVMVAGVFMNLVLAWVLLSIGFSFGMQPLLVSDDVFPAVDNGVVVLQEGAVVESVEPGSSASLMGILPGDSIVRFEGDSVVDIEQVDEILANPVGQYVVARGGELFWTNLTQGDYDVLVESGGAVLGAAFKEMFYFPRVRIHEVDFESNAYRGGLRSNDVVIAINDTEIYSLPQFRGVIEDLDEATITVYRDGVRKDLLIDLDVERRIIVSGVVKDKPAYNAGLEDGDVIASVNGKFITESSDFVAYVTEHKDEVLGLSIQRGDEVLFKEVKPEDGKLGVYLSELYSGEYSGFSVYNVDQFTSVVEIKNEQYPFYTAPFYALSETWRMTKLTSVFFVDFLKQFVQTGEVSENVAGPVGIAKMTGVFAREGLIPLLRFIALLSISLAVLNILPFPALDGGKLLFIFIEFVVGRKVPMKWENYIHLFGYLLIVALIFAVTYRDILSWVGA